MKPNNTKTGTAVNMLGDVEEIDLQVDPKAMAHIMYLLTNLYSDEELACIREYATNAWDSHIVAGQTRPIEVSTPTRLSAYFRIKDYGIGMNKADLYETFAFYGASTKREDERQNGAMGIGGKAALAYGHNFTVIGVKDGIKTSIAIGRNDRGTATATVLDESKTDEPNGVEITIPVKNYNEFARKAQNFFKFWAPGTVLIDGKEPNRDDMEQFTDRLWFHDGDSDLVVMGNVAYPYARNFSIGNRRVAAYVTMNGDDEIVFTPNREDMIYNGITNNVIEGLRKEFNERILSYMTGEIDKCENFASAYKRFQELCVTYGRNSVPGMADITYNDLRLSNDVLKWSDDSDVKAKFWHTGRSRGAVNMGTVYVETLINNSSLIITGYSDGDGVSSNHKARIKAYMTKNGIPYDRHSYYGKPVVLFSSDSLPDDKRTEGVVSVSWADLMKDTKPEKVERSEDGFSYDGAYDVYVGGAWSIEHLDKDDEILYFSPANESLPSALRDRILEEDPDIKFVSASANRHAKLARLYPNAKEFKSYEWYKHFGVKDFDALSEDDLAVLRAKEIYTSRYVRYNYIACMIEDIPSDFIERIEDPEIREAATLYFSPQPMVGWAGNDPRMQTLEQDWNKEAMPDWNSRYPLCNWSNYPEESLEYMNLVYNKNKEN